LVSGIGLRKTDEKRKGYKEIIVQTPQIKEKAKIETPSPSKTSERIAQLLELAVVDYILFLTQLSPILGAVITPQSTTMGALSAPIFIICVLLLRGSN
jgi:hypothetical protein